MFLGLFVGGTGWSDGGWVVRKNYNAVRCSFKEDKNATVRFGAVNRYE